MSAIGFLLLPNRSVLVFRSASVLEIDSVRLLYFLQLLLVCEKASRFNSFVPVLLLEIRDCEMILFGQIALQLPHFFLEHTLHGVGKHSSKYVHVVHVVEHSTIVVHFEALQPQLSRYVSDALRWVVAGYCWGLVTSQLRAPLDEPSRRLT